MECDGTGEVHIDVSALTNGKRKVMASDTWIVGLKLDDSMRHPRVPRRVIELIFSGREDSKQQSKPPLSNRTPGRRGRGLERGQSPRRASIGWAGPPNCSRATGQGLVKGLFRGPGPGRCGASRSGVGACLGLLPTPVDHEAGAMLSHLTMAFVVHHRITIQCIIVKITTQCRQ